MEWECTKSGRSSTTWRYLSTNFLLLAAKWILVFHPFLMKYFHAPQKKNKKKTLEFFKKRSWVNSHSRQRDNPLSLETIISVQYCLVGRCIMKRIRKTLLFKFRILWPSKNVTHAYSSVLSFFFCCFKPDIWKKGNRW